MDWMNPTLAILVGLSLRLAIPIVVTLLAVYILHKADVRWQEEAAQALMNGEKLNCWDIKNCTAEQKSKCTAPNSAEPCWQAHRLSNGYLREECLNCEVFHQAPILVQP